MSENKYRPFTAKYYVHDVISKMKVMEEIKIKIPTKSNGKEISIATFRAMINQVCTEGGFKVATHTINNFKGLGAVRYK